MAVNRGSRQIVDLHVFVDVVKRDLFDTTQILADYVGDFGDIDMATWQNAFEYAHLRLWHVKSEHTILYRRMGMITVDRYV